MSKQLSTAHLTPAQVSGNYQQAVTFAGEQIKALDKRIKYLSSLHTLNEYQKRDLLLFSNMKAALEGVTNAANLLTEWRYERHLELSQMHQTSADFEAVVGEKFAEMRQRLKEQEAMVDYALELKVA